MSARLSITLDAEAMRTVSIPKSSANDNVDATEMLVSD